MKILTNFNASFEMNEVPEQIDDIRFCVLDYADPNNVDYYFHPLVMIETFSSPVVELMIGEQYFVAVPLDWSIVVGDLDCIEVMNIKHLNDRGFKGFCFNPIGENRKGYLPSFLTIEVVNIFPNIKWTVPKLKSGHILTVPLEEGHNPMCAFFVKEISKISEVLDISKLI
jgi:hypothetical protein